MDDDKTKDNEQHINDPEVNQPGNTPEDDELTEDTHSDYRPADRFDASAVHHLSGMYKNWFLDYASYVILERAVPSIEDGLKPVQRRILHTMKRMDDGRYNKVANIVGETMKFHPHGDASIGTRRRTLRKKPACGTLTARFRSRRWGRRSPSVCRTARSSRRSPTGTR